MVSSTANMEPVFDLRNDHAHRGKLLAGLNDQWRRYLNGELPVRIAEGCVTRLFFSPYDGEQMFEIENGEKRSIYPRQEQDSRFAVGREVAIEIATFDALVPIGELLLITRIWI